MSLLTLDIPSGRSPDDSVWTRVRRFVRKARLRLPRDVFVEQTHLLPEEMERAGLHLNSRSESSLPFRR